MPKAVLIIKLRNYGKRLGDLNFIENAERQRQSLESDKQAYETLHHELCDLLGISLQSHIWEVQRAFKRQKELLSKDAHVGACQSAMNSILRDLKSQVERLSSFAPWPHRMRRCDHGKENCIRL
jgi:hypothetical protein